MALQHPAFLNCLSVVDKAAMGNNTVGKSVVDGVDRGSVDKGSSMDSVGNNRGVVDNWVGNGVDSVDRGSSNVATSRGRGVDGLTRVGDLSNVAGQVVGVVGDGLDPAVGKVDGVRSGNDTSSVVGLGLLEGGLGVVVGDGVGVGVGGGLSEVGGSVAGNGVDDGGRGVLGSGGGDGHKGKGGEGLKVSENMIFDWR